MQYPSPSAKRVQIGAQYRPERFEQRDPFSYRARMPEFSTQAERLQSALLADARRTQRAAQRSKVGDSLVTLICGAGIAVIVVWLGMPMLLRVLGS